MKIYRSLYLFDPRVPYVAHVDQEKIPSREGTYSTRKACSKLSDLDGLAASFLGGILVSAHSNK